ncbi:MAG TPA: pyridoxal-phosphate dependent enzyme [Salinisphaeraceae bacterium]|nr:pyridoxal-phosphate dependent enzyme [Salinisphaeraceae bacterium]
MQAPDRTPVYADIEAAGAIIAAQLAPTPLLPATELGASLAGSLYLKCESLQVTGSFKPRGALNWIANATAEELAAGLVTVSAGNHATGLAWAARARQVPVTVIMPADASPLKAQAARDYGAEVRLIGDINGAWAAAYELAESGLTLVPPYDEPRIIAGQGSIGLELLQQCPRVPDVVVCPVGGGGLISGLGLALKQAQPQLRLVGVEPAGAPTLRASWDAGEPVTLQAPHSIAASLGANRAGIWTHALSQQVVDELITLDEATIIDGTRATMTRGRLYAEPGGAIAVAALLAGRVSLAAGETAVAIVSGGNMDLALLQQML